MNTQCTQLQSITHLNTQTQTQTLCTVIMTYNRIPLNGEIELCYWYIMIMGCNINILFTIFDSCEMVKLPWIQLQSYIYITCFLVLAELLRQNIYQNSNEIKPKVPITYYSHILPSKELTSSAMLRPKLLN